MEADGESSPPQRWSTPTTLLIPVRRRHGRISPILNPEALILAIPILVLLIIFLILSPFFSYTNNQILNPSLVQKGWDSINVFLVLIAVLCGVFAKRYDDNSSSLDLDSVTTDVTDDNIRKSIANSKWLDFPDKSEYDKMTSSRSYPDLRQESLWGCESNGFKCFDDFEVNFHRQPEKLCHRERRSQKVETEAVAEPVRRRRSVHRGRNDDEKNENQAPPPPPPPAALSPPLPPPEPEFIRPVAEKTERIQREKGNATKEIATAIASLQHGTQKQKKKKVRDIYESAAEDLLPPSAIAPPSTPPPPPPPPPSKGLHSLLRKSIKSKRVYSVPTTAQPSPPPLPPPPNSFFSNIFKTGSTNKRCQIPSASAHPPPPPTSSMLIPSFENLTKSRRFKNSDTPTPPLPPPPPPAGIRLVHTGKPPKPNTSSHKETAIIVPPSPLIPMPPPPPPPLRTPEINFVPKMSIESDSGHSIRPSVSCPSPDVNTKADTFISRLRNGWRLEKLNSINERHNSVSSTLLNRL